MSGPAGERRIRQRALEAALALLADGRPLSEGLLTETATRAGCSEAQVRRFFPHAEDVVFALYARLAVELEARTPDMPVGTVAERFDAAMEAKLALIAPHRAALASVIGRALDPRHRLGALSAHTEIVRARVVGVFAAVVLGATDQPVDDAVAARLARTLYAAHLALLLVALPTASGAERAEGVSRSVVHGLLERAGTAGWEGISAGSLALLDRLAGPFVDRAPDPAATATAEAILRSLFRHRRLQSDAGACATEPCARCLALHLPRVRRAVLAEEPVHFLLPAFPAKSPSPRKVLGTLPDKAEEIALEYLDAVCEEIGAIYPPGARVTICSDGSVFSDLVGVSDEDGGRYGQEIIRQIGERYPDHMDHFALDDLFGDGDFDRMRSELVTHYAESLEAIRERTLAYPRHQALYNGIHRFLIEEYPNPDGALSKNRVRELCKPLTYEVIRRSDAWGRLIADCFPASLRLSIHPQDPHAEKIGIRLAETEDAWITPWHGVGVERADGSWTLMKRSDAEALPGAVLVQDATGRPSHFHCKASTPEAV